MDKKTIEISATGVLVVLLLLLLSRSGVRVKSRHITPKTYAPSKLGVQEPPKEKLLFWELDEKTKDLVVKRDPFSVAPVASLRAASHGLYLNGIAWDKEKPIAIINESILGVGDRVDSYIVVEIKQDRVILNDGTSDVELKAE